MTVSVPYRGGLLFIRDLMATACPGKFPSPLGALYLYLPKERRYAVQISVP